MPVKIDTDEVSRFLIKFSRVLPAGFPTKELMTDIGDYVAARIKTRTLAGKDVDLSPFVAYAPSTVKQRAKKGLQTSHVDLFASGKMLAAVGRLTTTSNEVLIGLSSGIEAKKAIIHKLGLGLPKRDWFGIGTDKVMTEGITKIADEALDKAIKDAIE